MKNKNLVVQGILVAIMLKIIMFTYDNNYKIFEILMLIIVPTIIGILTIMIVKKISKIAKYIKVKLIDKK